MPPELAEAKPTNGPRDARPDDQSGARWAMTQLSGRRGASNFTHVEASWTQGLGEIRCALPRPGGDRL
jgi:hypothetical protein